MAAILVAAHHDPGIAGRLVLTAVLGLMCVLLGLVFSLSRPIGNMLGPSGIAVMTRIMGLVLRQSPRTCWRRG